MPQKIILDTDIGDDIDDAMALGLILNSPELELIGITTVFGNTLQRARQAQTILKIAGQSDIPVYAGIGAPISPRLFLNRKPLRNGNPGHEPYFPVTDFMDENPIIQSGAIFPDDQLPPLPDTHAVTYLVDTLMSGDGDIIPVTIGAMTNLAVALTFQPKLVTKIPRIVSMAATFDRQYSEWNIKCDPVAAAIVFNSGIPMTVVGLDVTTKVIMAESEAEKLYHAVNPVSSNIGAAARLWRKRSPDLHPCLHDPLAVETLIIPEVVKTQRGTVTVELSGDKTYGYTTVDYTNAGVHDVCVEVDRDKAIATWLDRVLPI